MTASSDPLRLLFLLPFPPRLDASHGGGRVAAQLLSRLAVRHRVALIYFRGAEEQPLDPILQKQCELAEQVHRPWSGSSFGQQWARNSRLALSLCINRPMWVTDWCSKKFSNRVRSIAESWRPNIVQIEYAVMGQYVSALNGCRAPRVLSEYEPGVRAAPYLKRLSPALSRWVHACDQRAWKRFEPTVIRSTQAVIVFTQRDREALETFALPNPIHQIPFGTIIPDHPLTPLGDHKWNLLFVGSFYHSPNVDAALRLAREIFPSLKRRFPELQLNIVGEDPPPELRNTADPNIFVTGRVPDVKPYLDGATLFVAPLRSGGGMRVKVLEALAAGKPVVASRLALEGLDIEDGKQAVFAETDQEWSDRIAELLNDPAQRLRLASSAREWAVAHLSWEEPVKAYEALYRSLLKKSED